MVGTERTCIRCATKIRKRPGKSGGYTSVGIQCKLIGQDITVGDALKVERGDGENTVASGYVCQKCRYRLGKMMSELQMLPTVSGTASPLETISQRRSGSMVGNGTRRRCIRCATTIRKRPGQSGGYSSYSIHCKLIGQDITVSDALRVERGDGENTVASGHVCTKCRYRLSKMMSESQMLPTASVAHSLDVIPHVRCGFTPKKRQLYNRTTKGTTTSKKLKNYKAMAGKMLSKSNYAQMLTLLWKSSQAFHTALQEFVRKQVYKEARQFRTKPCKLRQNLSVSSIMDFDWTTTLQEIKAGMPFIHRIFCGMLETRKLSNGKITRVPPTEQRLGASIAVMLANRQPRTYKLLQSWVGVELWRSGCRQKGFSCLRELGMSQSAKATRACVDRVGSEFDAEPCNWKRDIEVGHQSSTDDVDVQPLRFTSDEDEDDVNVARREPLTLDVSQ